MKLSLRQRSSLAVLVAAGLAAAALVMVSLTWSRLRWSGQRAEGAQTRLLLLEELLSQVKDLEASQRGFLLTANDEYLKVYDTANADLEAKFDKLEEASVGDEALSGALVPLKRKKNERIGFLQDGIMIRKREGLGAAQDFLKANPGETVMASFRKDMNDLINAQTAVARDAASDMHADLRVGLLAAMSSGVAALLSGAVALWFWRHGEVRAVRERRLVYEKARAEEADRQKSAFLATMSHEIRTPMNAILGFGELLRAEAANSRQHRYADSILTAGRALLQLINDVLDISKIEAGSLLIRTQPADLREIGGLVHTLFSEEAASKKITLSVDIAPSVPPAVLMDLTRLRQIIVNMVGNALKFTEQGHIAVRIRSEAATSEAGRVEIHLEIEDSGIGILPEERDRIFKPFVQGARITDARQPGTGLGLAIVRRLTELMGGTITFDSEPGRGSTFRFVFPDIEVSARLAAREVEESAVNFADFAPFEALVVDDNEANRTVIADFFHGTPHRLRFAADGREAVSEVGRKRPDIVLMDLRMPNMDGHEALARIRRKPGCELLPVVAVSASGSPMDNEAARSKFDGVIRKPFSRARLYSEIAHFLPQAERPVPEFTPAARPAPPAEPLPPLPKAIIDELKSIERHELPELRDTMSMAAIRRLALRLEEIAGDHKHRLLAEFASNLTQDAEGVLMSAVESALDSYPSLVRRLATAVAPTPPEPVERAPS